MNAGAALDLAEPYALGADRVAEFRACGHTVVRGLASRAEVGAIHPKAMPVILTTPDEVETWMTAPPEEALKLDGRFRTGRSKSSSAASRKIRPGRQRDRRRR